MADVNRLHHGFGRTREVFSIGGAEIDKAQSRPGIACRTPLLGSPADGALTVDPDLEGGRRTFFHGYGWSMPELPESGRYLLDFS